MAILWIKEQPQGREGTWQDDAVKEFTRTFKVRVDAMDVGPVAVKKALEAQVDLFDFYVSPDGSDDSDAMASRIRVSQSDEGNPFVYIAEVSYTTATGIFKFADADTTKRPWEYSWGSKPYQRPAISDITGQPILNTAGDRVANYERDDSRLTLTVTRNELAFDPRKLRQYKDALNADGFFGFPPGYAKMAMPRGQDFWERGVRYWKVTYDVDFRDDGDVTALDDDGNPVGDDWRLHLVNSGFHEIITLPIAILGELNVRSVICDKTTGTPFQQEQLLDKNGHRLAVGATPFYTHWDIYDSVPFAPLKLENQYGK